MSATLVQPRGVPLAGSAGRVGSYVDADDPLLFRRGRSWWLVIALFLMAQGNSFLNQQDDQYWSLKRVSHLNESSPIYLLITVILWLIGAGLMTGRLGPALRMMLRQRAVLALGILACLSTLWSPDPSLTLRKAIVLVLTFFFAWFFVTAYSPGDQMRILIAVGIMAGIASIVVALLFPHYGIASTGEWKGIFGQKNRLGLGMVYMFSGLPFCSLSDSRRRISLFLMSILPLGLILLCQSRTSLIMVMVLIVIRILGPLTARAGRDQRPFIWYSILVGTAVVSLTVSMGADLLLSAVGRDATLSGRTEHWPLLVPFAMRHLWLGYGYDGFWTGTGDSLAVIRMIGATMAGSDSGYMDVLLQFGVTGLGLLLFLLFLSPVRELVRLLQRPAIPLIAYWYAGVILATAVGSITELLFPTSSGIITFVFATACAGLSRLRQEGSVPGHTRLSP